MKGSTGFHRSSRKSRAEVEGIRYAMSRSHYQGVPGSSRIGCRGVEVYCGWRYSLLRILLLRISVDVPSRVEALSLWAYRCVSGVILSCASLI